DVDDANADADADAGEDDGDTDEGEDEDEIEAIIDGGSDPAVPPSAPNPPPTDFALRDFDEAIGTLKRLMTKSSAQFARTTDTVDDLKNVESCVRAVTKPGSSERQETDSEELQKMRIERAGLLSEIEELKQKVTAVQSEPRLVVLVRGGELKVDDLGDLAYSEV